MKYNRLFAWFLLSVCVATYAAARFQVIGLSFDNPTKQAIYLGFDLGVTIEQTERALVLFKDSHREPRLPNVYITWIVPPLTEIGFGPKWYGIYYRYVRWSNQSTTWTVGISLRYFIALSMLWVLFIEIRAANNRRRLRRSNEFCLACGYPRRGLVTDSCPECGAKFNSQIRHTSPT